MNFLIEHKRYLVISIAVLIVYLIWDFGIRPSRQLYLECTGVITSTYKSRSWIRPNEGVLTGDPDYRNRFFWRIKTDTGKTVNLEVNRKKWSRGQPGMRITKRKGHREPILSP